MVAPKGKLSAGMNGGVERSLTHQSVGVRNFKVYAESEGGKADANIIGGKAVTGNKRVSLTTSQNTMKVGLNTMEKSKGKVAGTASKIVRRKALADVSNVQGNNSRKVVHDGPKLMKSKSERTTSLQRVSIGLGRSIVKESSRKSSMGKEQENVSQGVDAMRASSRNKSIGQSHASAVRNCRTTRSSLLSDRKSLPTVKQANQADASIMKENAGSSDKGKERSGYLVGKASKKVAPRLNSGRSYLWKNRASDGFIIMGQTNIEAHPLQRKSIKPIVKTTLQATQAERTSKLKNKSGLNKCRSIVEISSKNKEDNERSLPETNSTEVQHEAGQGQQHRPDADGNLRPVSDLTVRRKSDRRRSFSSSLITRSKLLEKCVEVMKLDKLPTIDDHHNQLEVAEYVDEIYQYYWVMEAQDLSLANYISIHTNITAHMRGILINWLIEVHFKFDLMQETLFLMVTLLDRYLSQATIKKNELQLVGLTALLLASKYEDFWHPRVKDLISISAESYTRDQMLAMERLILKQLKFRLNVATPYVFMLRFLKASQTDTKLEHLAFYLIELCLVEYEALKYKPSLLCASAIYIARSTLHITPAWNPLLCKHTCYEESQLRDSAEMILGFHKAAGTGQLRVTYEKYLRPDFSRVAAITALDRLPL